MEQQLRANSFDIIIATNVLHATSNALSSLRNATQLLKPNGFIILNEGIAKRDFSTIAYGLTDGWWAFNDDALRIPGSPFLDLDTWLSLLHQVGYNHSISLNNITNIPAQVYQDVIIAQL